MCESNRTIHIKELKRPATLHAALRGCADDEGRFGVEQVRVGQCPARGISRERVAALRDSPVGSSVASSRACNFSSSF